MSKFKFTDGEWKTIHETLVMQNDRSIASCGGYSTNRDMEKIQIENEANAKLISCAPKMIKILIGNYITYAVLKEVFEFNRPNIWQMIKGAYLDTPDETKQIIESATGMTIENAIKAGEEI